MQITEGPRHPSASPGNCRFSAYGISHFSIDNRVHQVMSPFLGTHWWNGPQGSKQRPFIGWRTELSRFLNISQGPGTPGTPDFASPLSAPLPQSWMVISRSKTASADGKTIDEKPGKTVELCLINDTTPVVRIPWLDSTTAREREPEDRRQQQVHGAYTVLTQYRSFNPAKIVVGLTLVAASRSDNREKDRFQTGKENNFLSR
jgi:hypothetical protein